MISSLFNFREAVFYKSYMAVITVTDKPFFLLEVQFYTNGFNTYVKIYPSKEKVFRLCLIENFIRTPLSFRSSPYVVEYPRKIAN